MTAPRIRQPGSAIAAMVSIAVVLMATAAGFPQGAGAHDLGVPVTATSAKRALRIELHTRSSAKRALRRCRRHHPQGRCARRRASVRRAARRIAVLRADLGSLGMRIANDAPASNPRASDASRRISQKTGGHNGKASSTTTSGSSTTTSTSTSTTTTTTTTTTEAAPPSATESTTTTSSSGSDFGPFVKGVDTNLQGWGVEAMPQIASEMHELGVNWEREDLSWSTVEATKGVYNWSTFDKVVAAAKENGITILPLVGYAPSWAKPEDATDYAAFVKAAVERYGPGTSANLQWWELWNEPYAPYAWSNQTPDAEAYARDALAAAKAAKSVSPNVKLLVAAEYNDSPQTGGSSPWETTWVADMFTAAPELASYISGVSVHPYGGDPALPLEKPGSWYDIDGEWAFQRIDTIREQFLEHGVNVPFWVTEDGWSTATVSETEQAQDYSALMTEIAARPWIRAFFPYCLREFSPESSDVESSYGLLKFGTWQPKQAFDVVKAGFNTLD